MSVETVMPTNKLSDEDYARLKTFFMCYLDWFIPDEQKSHDPEDQPLAFLGRLEDTSLTNAKRGLQMAINDMVEATSDWTQQQVAEADARFASADTFTLSEVRCRYSNAFDKIMKRGVIRSEAEYYMIKGVFDGGTHNAGNSEREKIERMLSAFEARVHTG